MIVLTGGSYSLPLDTEVMQDLAYLAQRSSLRVAISGVYRPTISQTLATRRTYVVLADLKTRNALEQFLARNLYAPFNFIDHRGFMWLVGTGTNDAHTAYSTGAFFNAGTELSWTPQSPNGESCENRWQTPLSIIVNARGLNGNSFGGNTMLQTGETPAGSINGINAAFTLSIAPSYAVVTVNGLVQIAGVSYNLVGSTITFTAGNIPQSGDSLFVYPVI